MFIILPPREYLKISPKDYIDSNKIVLQLFFITPEIVKKLASLYKEQYELSQLNTSPVARQLNNTYDILYKTLINAQRNKTIKEIPDNIILHVDECQAEITGTQRLSYTQRLKLHRTYLKKLIKKTGYKPYYYKQEPKVHEETTQISLFGQRGGIYITAHAIEQAKKRYGIELNYDDLRSILNNILEGNAKLIKKPKNVYGCEGKGDLYNIRYNGVLMQAVVIEDRIVTFNPVGKRKSWNKAIQQKVDKNFTQMIKRKKM